MALLFGDGETGLAATLPTAAPVPAALASHPELPATERVLLVEAGKERWVAASEAAAAGYTLVDLSDDWTPFIFQELLDGSGNPMSNRYRSVYLGLANDTGDGDGQPLGPGEHNYLELFGIPPTLSVLRTRFLEESEHAEECKLVDAALLRGVASIPAREQRQERKVAAQMVAEGRRLEELRRRAQVDSLDALAERSPALAKRVAQLQRYQAQRGSFPEVEKRLSCEGLLRAGGKHVAGQFDEPMREALVKFQRKHMLYDGAALRPRTMTTLGRSLLENDYDALVRVLTERVVAAANILEDGTAKGARNLVAESLQAAVTQLGLETPEAALAFFGRHPAADFAELRAAVKLPAVPEYYSDKMDFSVVIDRGDVIYDPPYDPDGKPTKQNRQHFPHLTLHLHYRGKNIPLVRWRTTIGGWRSDVAANGYEYYRYKGSDVGPRVWRNIVSGPVWIPPTSTPLRTLVKWKRVHGTSQLVVNYDEVGPGFLSAYGLVAAYNVVPGKNGRPDFDNGVRVHGSSEILSILNSDAYSHGCHRLMNHLAVRLFSFILRHHAAVVEGDRPLDLARQFLFKDDVYEMRLPSRGFWYRIEPPIPVSVLEGNIIGKVKKPILTYVPKPGVTYPPGPMPIPKDAPEARAGGSP